MARGGFRVELKLAQKQRSFHLMAATCMVGGRLVKPLPLTLLRWEAGVKQHMWSQHKPARMEDFKAAPHKYLTQGLSEGSPVIWLQARCTQTRPLAGQRGPYPCQFWSSANQRASPLWDSHLGGHGPPPRLAEHLLLSNMPTRSPQCHNRPLIHTSLNPQNTPPSHCLCQVGPNTCLLSHKHKDLPVLPS